MELGLLLAAIVVALTAGWLMDRRQERKRREVAESYQRFLETQREKQMEQQAVNPSIRPQFKEELGEQWTPRGERTASEPPSEEDR